MFDYSDSSPI